MNFQRVQCCGVRELSNLSSHRTSEAAFLDMGRWIYGSPRTMGARNMWRYAIFSQAREETTYGVRFAAYIRKHQLGELIETGFNVNPNSSNPLKLWTWTIDWAQFKTHYDALMAAGARGVKPEDLRGREIFTGEYR